MLFNSHVFLFVFLPLTLIGFFLISHLKSQAAALAWLIAASLFFYGWWDPAFVPVILLSIAANFGFGVGLARAGRGRRSLLAAGVTFNLSLLAYYKYAYFLLASFAANSSLLAAAREITLPLAISFFTFQQIAYLVDVYRGKAREYRLLHYCLFVTFFPQLIAGPIVHHREMMPQFARRDMYRCRSSNLAAGLTIFILGLAKKTIVADGMGTFVGLAFGEHGTAAGPGLLEAWAGAFAYTFQIYFDFSGYSDMAIGLGRMFGIRLPVNFDSPYKATNIVDFWRRWHMTLSRFFLQYLYIPLGGNRRGSSRQSASLLLTMLLGGLWHGASWTFVLWGGLHGMYLVINHGWRRLLKWLHPEVGQEGGVRLPWLSRGVTFTAVVFGWVLFRAESFESALQIYRGMLGFHGITAASDGWTSLGPAYLFAVVLLALVWLAPNTQEIMSESAESDEAREWQPGVRGLRWSPNWVWAGVVSLLAAASVLGMTTLDEFIYFQF
jgi:D-alanyl-lipoteichoic acid acyltransferase DltB (MBOAT superfamily)